MPPISLMLKPVSSSCNMKCKYCFYHSLAEYREQADYGNMSDKILELAIKKAFDYASGDRVYLAFHGGEPLLRGIEFYRKAIEYINKYNRKNSEFIVAFQTNGLPIDDEWCEFFKENHCLVGISLDGDRAANRYRVDNDGNETFDRVLDALDSLQYYEVDFNVLTVATKHVAKNIKAVYEFLTSRGYKYLQFTPCLKPFEKEATDDIYMNGEEYGEYLIELTRLYFDDYINHNYVSVRQIDNFVRLVNKYPAFQCGMNGNCSYQFVIEADGTVFPCDFYCVDQYRLGNIGYDEFENMQKGKIQTDFVTSSTIVEEKCKMCKYYALCRNGCKRERPDIDKCTAYNKYFDAMMPYLKFLGNGIEK